MVGLLGRVVAKADDITAVGGIAAQHVVDLVDGEIMIARHLRCVTAGAAQPIAVEQGDESGVGGVAQRPPLVQPS